MGVPILRGGRVLGVLVVQNRTRAPLHRGGDRGARRPSPWCSPSWSPAATWSTRAAGPAERGAVAAARPARGAAPGRGRRASASAVLHEPRIEVTRLVAEDPDERGGAARGGDRQPARPVDELLLRREVADRRASRHPRSLSHVRRRRRLAAPHARGDPQRPDRRGGGAEGAGRDPAAHGAGRRSLSARAAGRSRRPRRPAAACISPGAAAPIRRTLPDEFILVARSLGPAELLDYDRARLRGVVLEEGSPTAHVAIVARALDIPVVGRVRGALAADRAGRPHRVDGDNGQVFVRPGEDVEQAFARAIAGARGAPPRATPRLRDLPAVTRDGIARRAAPQRRPS